MATQEELELAVQAAFAEEAGDLLRQVERSLHGLAGGDPAERVPRCLEMLRGLHTLKGAAAAAGAVRVKETAHALEDLVRGVVEGSLPLEGPGMESIFSGLEHIYAALAPEEPKKKEVDPAVPPAVELPVRGGEESLRVRPARVEALHALVGELVLGRLQQEEVARRLLETRELLGEALERFHELGARMEPLRRTLPRGQWAALKASREACGPVLTEAFHALSGVGRELHALQSQAVAVEAELEEGIRELRLMPLQPLLEEYTRVAREAARTSGKEVRLDVRAEGAEVDRVVLMRLREVLLHLVRNAVVHGLETPERRREAGKPAVGTLTLEARCEGARAVLKVADDGAGIDVERVRQRAREAGLAGAEGPLDGQALLELLSQPGFSMREEVDELAGRGIGLDVVVRTLRDLDGELRLEHVPGEGTTFLLDVPVSAAMHRGLVVRVGEDCFGVLLHQVERALRVGAADVGQLEGRSTVRVGDEPVALVPLASLLGLEARAEEAERLPVVVLRLGGQRLALLVDDVPGEQRMVLKPLGPAFAGAELVQGGALQPNGSVLPVLNVPALFNRAAGRADAYRASAVLAVKGEEAPCAVLVVDDSPTMRTLLRNVLRAAGYRVTVANDGLAAMEVWEEQPFALVVSDLQMPRLDGLGVCRFVRRSHRPCTPVMLVTSVATEAERRRAMDAGVDAYVVKGEFEQASFLAQVRELTGRGGRACEAAAG